MQRYLKRDALSDLGHWLDEPARRPLVVRGARQTGKTFLVRALAQSAGRTLVELNFERNPELISLFSSNEPQQILRLIEARLGLRPTATTTSILFLDEIQAAPELLGKLRWFAEELSELPVIAAGSLLDFVLAEHQFSMPVGRIRYLYLEPMTFEEFLNAVGETSLREYVETLALDAAPPEALHQRLALRYSEYLLVGGMPASVAVFADTGSWVSVAETQQSLLTTFKDDFAKYSSRIPPLRLLRLLDSVPRQLCQKFRYSLVDQNERADALRRALDLLCRARLCHRVRATDGAGLPLAAGVRERYFKVIHLDVGMISTSLGLDLQAIQSAAELTLVNRGALAEQVAGQTLRAIEPRYVDPALHYWTREHPGSAAEVDYLIQHGPTVLPVEVKAGSTGRLRSLHLFMAHRKLDLAVRICSQPPTVVDIDTATSGSMRAKYRLVSLPFYLAGQVRRLVSSL